MSGLQELRDAICKFQQSNNVGEQCIGKLMQEELHSCEQFVTYLECKNKEKTILEMAQQILLTVHSAATRLTNLITFRLGALSSD